MATRKQRSEIQVVGDLLAPALRALGMPSARLTRRVLQAWERIADPSWARSTRPTKLVGGVLFIEVESAALRQELAQFHAERLLSVLKTAISDVHLIGIRFRAGTSDADRNRARMPEGKRTQGDK